MEYHKIKRKIQCPVCYTDSAHSLWEANSKQAAQHFVLQEKEPERFLELASHIKHLWGQEVCEVVQCDKCGFCYSNPYVAGDERFYTLAYERTGYPEWKWEFQMTYNVLDKSGTTGKKLMEIGAGNGAFIKMLLENIVQKEDILCTEFSEYGRNQIERMGVKCLPEDVRNLSDATLNESMDVVCMFQVLEHMDRLGILFQKLNWMIKPGGSLFIAVPNPAMIEFNELNGALLDMPPNHIGRWNKRCFEEIGTKYGFRIADHQVEKSGFLAKAKEFIIYRFHRRSQKSGSFENGIQKIKKPVCN